MSNDQLTELLQEWATARIEFSSKLDRQRVFNKILDHIAESRRDAVQTSPSRCVNVPELCPDQTSLGTERIATALLISSFDHDHVYFENLFGRTNWRLFHARTSGEAFEILGKQVIPVIVVDETIGTDGWTGVLEKAWHLPYPPKLIVASCLTTDGVWADVLNLGGYDVLARPLDQHEVLHSIMMAWLAWKHDAEREAALETLSTKGTKTPRSSWGARASG